MQAGLLNEIIEIYKPELSVNEFGEQIQTYVKCYETKARVIHSAGSRNIENNEIVNNYSKTLQIRYYVDINETYQIKYQGKMYRVTSIEEVRQYNYKEIIVELINS